jgi:hypothetical protein
MTTENDVAPTGTGQEGAGSPAGVNVEVPVHIEGKPPVDKLDRLANRAARKGVKRQNKNRLSSPSSVGASSQVQN